MLPPVRLAWAATVICLVGALLLAPYSPGALRGWWGALRGWWGYALGIVATILAMLCVLEDRRRQTDPGFVRTMRVVPWARVVRGAAFAVTLGHILVQAWRFGQ